MAPQSVESHTWYTANLGMRATLSGPYKAPFYMSKIEKHGTKAMSLDNKYYNGTPVRLLGRYYQW